MKVLLLRVGALGAVVVLGWITLANAQRDNENTGAGQAGNPLYNKNAAADDSAQGANPLRATLAPAAEPAARRPAADPFGLQARRGGSSAVPSASLPSGDNSIPDASSVGLSQSRTAAPALPRYSQPLASTARPSTGPALGSGDSGSREPAPFKADPFAMPANPTRAVKDGRNSVGTAVQLPPQQPVQPPPQQFADSGRAVESVMEGEGTGQPGARQLDGLQSPQLSIQKLAPKEIQVGKTASFRVVVRNTGSVPACEVEVRDLVPKGTRLLGTTPQAGRGPRGEILWTLGTIRPGEEATVEMQLMPMAEGEIGSVATVHFGADASARTLATRPQLVVLATTPNNHNKVLIGERAMLTITVSNPGTGMATGVVLEERIPPGLQHPAGTELEYEVGNLKPGESRKLELPLLASRPGPATNLLSVRGDGNLHAEHKLDLEVLAPQLDVVLEGPKRRYLERQATYQLSVTNPGTAPAKQVELVANLPVGLKFISANNAGYYEEASRTVRWRLEELPANETGSVELVTMPIEAGKHVIGLRGTAQKGLTVEKEQPVLVEGIAAILFQVADTVDPVEVGGETTYEVRVVNQGSKAAANVQLAVDLPAEVKFAAAEGPTRYKLDGSRVSFDGLAQLAPKADASYRVRVKAVRPGDLRARFQLLTDDMQSPVTKEESTRVYADE